MIYKGVFVPQTQTTWWQRKGCCCLDRYSRNDRCVSPKRHNNSWWPFSFPADAVYLFSTHVRSIVSFNVTEMEMVFQYSSCKTPYIYHKQAIMICAMSDAD